MKLKDALARLQKATPKHSQHGQMYAAVEHTKRSYKRVTLHTLFVSSENTHLIRKHVFESKRARSPKEWAKFFSDNLTDIHRNAVLPGLALRTNKQWAVQRIIGWTADVKSSTRTAAMGRKRHKAKR